MSAHRKGSTGFTIMEVMVAVLILAVSVVSIFGAQFAAVATVNFSRYNTQAVQLARCKMSEIELEILTENGFNISDVIESGECCELMDGEESADAFSCRWEIKSVELPDAASLLTGGADGGMLDDFELGQTSSGEGDMMGGMLGAFLPMLSELLKQAIRRVTVTVEWEQGVRSRSFVLSQYLVHPTQGPLELMHSAAAAQEAMDTQQQIMGNTSGDTRGGGEK